MITLYCPLGDRDDSNRKRTEQLWQWAGLVKTRLPPRTRIVIGVDSNGHVGDVRRYTADLPEEIMSEIDPNDDYPHIGSYGAEEENYNGTQMREAAETNDLVVLNTWDPKACGKTWYGGKDCSSRVDYILTDSYGLSEFGSYYTITHHAQATPDSSLVGG